VLPTNIVVEFSHNLRGRLPAIERETSHDTLVEGQVGNGHDPDEVFVVGRQVNSFDSDRLRLSLKGIAWEVGEADLPLKSRSPWPEYLLAAEGELHLTLVSFHGRRASTNRKRFVHLQKVADMFQLGVKVNGFGVGRSAGHARRASSRERWSQSRSDQLT